MFSSRGCKESFIATAHLHVPDGRLVSIVDHLLEPQALVQHPHDDEPVLVTRGQLRVCSVPSHAYLFLQGETVPSHMGKENLD